MTYTLPLDFTSRASAESDRESTSEPELAVLTIVPVLIRIACELLYTPLTYTMYSNSSCIIYMVQTLPFMYYGYTYVVVDFFIIITKYIQTWLYPHQLQVLEESIFNAVCTNLGALPDTEAVV